LRLSERVTIGITTKDRWDELENTVAILVGLGLSDLPFILMDDGSREERALRCVRPLSDCRVVRGSESVGLVERRNQIAALARTDLLLSLDDDASLTSGKHLERAVAYLDANPNVSVVSARVINVSPHDARAIVIDDTDDRPIPVRSFHGGGHLLRVADLLNLGGYRGYFRYLCEERDYAMRLYGAGKKIALFPSFIVIHRPSLVGRCKKRFCFYRGQSTLLCWMLNAPGRAFLWRVIRCLVGVIYLTIKERGPLPDTLHGFVAAARLFAAHRQDRSAMPIQAYREWLRLAEL